MLRPLRPSTVLSFMSQWGGLPNTLQKNPPSAAPSPGSMSPAAPPSPSTRQQGASPNLAQSASALEAFNNDRPPSRTAGRERSDSRASVRPMSMIQTYQPPVMEVSQDTLPELQRIFMFLNSHSNKLYQEGYFLKFHDTDSRMPPPLRRACLACDTDSMQVAVPLRIGGGKSTLSSL
jgi:CCR4-NOT transcriptional complex subunit CAF120